VSDDDDDDVILYDVCGCVYTMCLRRKTEVSERESILLLLRKDFFLIFLCERINMTFWGILCVYVCVYVW